MGILDFIFPKRCVSCGALGLYICPPCRRSIRHIAVNESICPICERPAIDGATHPRCQSRFSLDGLTSFFHYEAAVRHAIKSLKYRHVSDLAEEFVSQILPIQLTHIQTCVESPSAILVPIPLHITRMRERGYNQAEVLGRQVAKALQIPSYTDILYRIRATVPQVATKNRKERMRNMNGVFGQKKSTKGAVIVLFDDVFTSGATMRSAAQVLKKHGAKLVWAVTIAR